MTLALIASAVMLFVAVVLWRAHGRDLLTGSPTAQVACVLLVLAAVLTPLIVWGGQKDAAYARWCRAQGGHVDSDQRTTIVTTGRTTVPVSSGSDFCLTSDGRIIDIR